MRRVGLSGLLLLVWWSAGAAQASQTTWETFDRVLDVYVRDGLVYYNALRQERAVLDRVVAGLDAAPWATGSEADRKAGWVNAYNALVLRTVINAYPIRGTSPTYPPSSIAQVPGAMTQTRHRVAGEALTLDQIEQKVTTLGDARLLLALGRGALGGGRLRSEAYTPERLDDQLQAAVREFVTRADTFRIDRTRGVVTVTPLASWREAALVSTFSHGGEMWSNRSPLERALMIMSYPHLFPSERQFLALNTFQLEFGAFDWRLNDLTGGGPAR
jgi:hypothetical protein